MPHQLARVVIINDSTVAKGGATKLALQLATGLASRGIAVTYFAGDDGDNPELKSSGVDVVCVGGVRLMQAGARRLVDGIYNEKAKKALEDLIARRDNKQTIYHLHGWAQILSPSLFDVLSDVADRTLLTAHDFFLACPNGNYSLYPQSRQCHHVPMSPSCLIADCDKRSFSHKVWRLARQAMLNSKANLKHRPYTVLAIQKGMIPFLTKGGVPEEKIRVMRNPAAQLTKERVRAEDNNTVLYVGRFQREKGVDLLAAAARAAGAKICLVGEGEAEESIRVENPQAEFCGWLGQDEIAARMAQARFLVMPSRCTEPFGLAGAEALRAGLPIMVSQSCLIGDDVEAAGMGAKVDIFDDEKFSSLVSHWMVDDKIIEKDEQSCV